MKYALQLSLFVLSAMPSLQAQITAGNSSGLVTNLPEAIETVNIFTFPPQFGQFDNEAYDSIDFNRDRVFDAFFYCSSSNTFDSDGGNTSAGSLHPRMEFMVDSGHHVRQLHLGDSINSAQIWENAYYTPLVTKFYGIFGYFEAGNWINEHTGYAGLRLIADADTLYGWAKIQASVATNGSASVKIIQWAMEHDPAQPPFLLLSVDPQKSVYCPGDTVILHANAVGASKIIWHLWDGSTLPSQDATIVLPDSSVVVQVEALNISGVTQKSVSLNVSPLQLSVQGLSLTCLNPTGMLSAVTNIPAVVYWLQGNDTLTGPDLPFISSPGPIGVFAVDAYGCVATRELLVTLDVEAPSVFIQTSLNSDSLLAFSSTFGVIFSWSGPGLVGPVMEPGILLPGPGEYTVTATAPNGCTSTASVTVNTSSSAEPQLSNLQIYPNPFSDHLLLQQKRASPSPLYLTDRTGKLIQAFDMQPGNQVQIWNVSTLPPGVYLIWEHFSTAKQQVVARVLKI